MLTVTPDALPSALLLSLADTLQREAVAKRHAILRHRQALVAALRHAGIDAGALICADVEKLPDAIVDALQRFHVPCLSCRLRQLLRRIDVFFELLFDVERLRKDARELSEM